MKKRAKVLCRLHVYPSNQQYCCRGYSGTQYLDMTDQNQPYPDGVGNYSTNLFTDRAKDIIQGYTSNDKPFFLWLSYTAPHSPLQVSVIRAFTSRLVISIWSIVCFIERANQLMGRPFYSMSHSEFNEAVKE